MAQILRQNLEGVMLGTGREDGPGQCPHVPVFLDQAGNGNIGQHFRRVTSLYSALDLPSPCLRLGFGLESLGDRFKALPADQCAPLAVDLANTCHDSPRIKRRLTTAMQLMIRNEGLRVQGRIFVVQFPSVSP